MTDTNALLDMYIDLMKQTERTQQLLADHNWKGSTEEEAMHALEVELAERERKRKQDEAERAAREEAARQAEERKRAAQLVQTSAARPGSESGRGTRGRGGPSRGTASARGATSARGTGIGRGIPTTTGIRQPSTTRGIARGTETGAGRAAPRSTSGGLNNRYANVRSSGYGPR